ncbi:MAG: hypothetical protein WAL63_10075 [Solirubrobacteraceae bacterium]
MRPVTALALVGAAYAVAGCGASANDEVQAKLQQFAHAVSSRDPVTLCRDVLAPGLVARLAAAGLRCETAMTTFVDGVTDPTLHVAGVHVDGTRASAVVRTGARGQPSSIQTVALTDTAHGWRLTSLASPR